jgi:hypothetical protein
VLCHTLEGAQSVQRQPASIEASLAHTSLHPGSEF